MGVIYLIKAWNLIYFHRKIFFFKLPFIKIFLLLVNLSYNLKKKKNQEKIYLFD
jgi:hypothetical protein